LLLNVNWNIADRLVDDSVLADAFAYQINLVQARADAGLFDAPDTFSLPTPPWFHPAMKQILEPINQRLDRLMALATQSARLSAIVRTRAFLSH
jgi:hypothetical protein